MLTILFFFLICILFPFFLFPETNRTIYLFAFFFEWFFAWSNMILGISWHCGHAESCSTLGDPMDHSPPGSSVHRIFQARIRKWVVISSPRELPNPGIEPCILYISCTGNKFWPWAMGSPFPGICLTMILFLCRASMYTGKLLFDFWCLTIIDNMPYLFVSLYLLLFKCCKNDISISSKARTSTVTVAFLMRMSKLKTVVWNAS